MIRAVTFDLWDTLVHDDSDEPRRRAAGLPSKAEARALAFIGEVQAWHPTVSVEAARAALAAADARARAAWKSAWRTPHLADRLRDAFAGLALAPTPGFESLVAVIAGMEVAVPPDAVEGGADALDQLREAGFKLAIVSDSIVSPGASLRRLLARHDLLRRFDATVFSDEVGRSKPHRAMFDAAADALGVAVTELVHVGDREANDVAGPHAVGARAILFTGAVDRGAHGSKAHAVAGALRDVPGIVARLQEGA